PAAWTPRWTRFTPPWREVGRPGRHRCGAPRSHRGGVLSSQASGRLAAAGAGDARLASTHASRGSPASCATRRKWRIRSARRARRGVVGRSEEHTSELQSLRHLVCRLLLEKKKKKKKNQKSKKEVNQ